MFCGKCGAQIPDGSGFCSSCGAPVGQRRPMQPQGQMRQPQQNYQQNYQQPVRQANTAQQPYYDTGFDAQKPVSNKKKFMILGIIAAAVVVVILLIVFLGGSGSTATPEGTIKKLEKGMNDLNTQTIMDCFDAESQSYFSGSDYDLKSLADTMGIKYNVTLTPTSVSPSYTENGKEYCDVTVDMYATYTMWGQNGSESDTQTIRMVHENGQWKITSDYYNGLVGGMF